VALPAMRVPVGTGIDEFVRVLQVEPLEDPVPSGERSARRITASKPAEPAQNPDHVDFGQVLRKVGQ
jgi:hypothetical protein